MRSWPLPQLPELPGRSPEPQVVDTRTSELVAAPGPEAKLYVCGITPYDATHLGHAFTYVAFDMLVRVLRDSGLDVDYTQNITDIDDPLFERAEATGVSWRELADSQIDLFRSDMDTLGVIPPTNWVAVSDVLDELEQAVRALVSEGTAYGITDDSGRTDYYVDADKYDGKHLNGIDLIAVFRENGGDPDREGKRNPLDPMIWKGALGDDFRAEGEKPGAWRPGWHIECALIGRDFLGNHIDIQGGGADLVFPHQEMTVTHHQDFHPEVTVGGQMNTGIVAYEGEKMSKSLGNLVLVSKLVERGFEPMAVRLALLNHRWDSDWEYTDEDLVVAERRLTRWRRARHTGGGGAEGVLEIVRGHLANNLDTPSALAAIDTWVECNERSDDRAGSVLFDDMCKTLLGVHL